MLQVFHNGERVVENGAGREVEVRRALRLGAFGRAASNLDGRRSASAGSWTSGDRRRGILDGRRSASAGACTGGGLDGGQGGGC
jgi:hypothetical protein